MTDIVTLEEVKAHVEVDHDLDDDLLDEKRLAAEAAVIDYLENDELAYGAESAPQVREAVLQLVATLYRYRDDPTMDNKILHGFLPFSVTMLIYRLRDPTVV